MTPTLLYIDDTEADVELLRTLVRQRGLQVEAALSGTGGIVAYNPERHCAVVIDWNLHDMTGLDVAKALLSQYPSCPVALISGIFEPEHTEAARALGISDCFEKDFHMGHIDRIRDFVRAASKRNIKHAV